MFDEVHILQMPLTVDSVRKRVERFLTDNGLEYEPLDYYAGVFKGDDMLAGGGFSGNVIKCVAVAECARDLNLTGKLLSHLRSECASRSADNIFVFTKPANEDIFKSLAFHTVGRSNDAILLESNSNGISSFCKSLARSVKKGNNGCIAVNCNPMTLGHRYLIETASRMVDNLYILVVSEDKSYFGTDERLDMVRRGTSDLSNVTVLEGGSYVISAATFPRYFIKRDDQAAISQMELDLDIFVKHIAPSLEISVRFVGSEPFDELTREYNNAMKHKLPASGIRVCEIERKSLNGKYISATEVRKRIEALRFADVFALVPPSSAAFVKAKFAELLSQLASDALTQELETTPKPGLVDKENSGAHKDMDLGMMARSINTLKPYFREVALTGLRTEGVADEQAIDTIRLTGLDAERAMLADTGGVNTYRGAIFSLGLCVFATAVIISGGGEPTPDSLSATIAKTARQFQKQAASNGAVASEKYGVRGALELAREGYPLIFGVVLPFYRETVAEEPDINTANLKTLLKIMTLLDDTNIYHRAGAERARQVKAEASRMLENYSAEGLREMDRILIRDNISPGGAADMLAMVILLDDILKRQFKDRRVKLKNHIT